MKKQICHDCGIEEGQIHKYGCDMEKCPFCHKQLIICDCCYEKLNLLDFDKYPDTTGLHPDIYTKGLNNEQEEEWMKILEENGRVPFIMLPIYCVKCLKPFPDFFSVPDEEWQELPYEIWNKVLCRGCYDMIKKWVKDGMK